MNIPALTLTRLNRKREKKETPKVEIAMAEPIKDVRNLFTENLEAFIKQATTSPQEQYQKFISENPPEEPKTSEIYGTIDLSELFRRCSDKLAPDQKHAFQGIESVRAYLDTANCNCASKKAKMEEYYRGFVTGNMQTDLFTTIKEKLKLEKITFFYESQIFLEI